MSNGQEEMVQVWVPRRHLAATYRFLGELEPAVTPDDERADGPWTPELLRRAFEESEDPLRAVLTYLAQRAGQRVPSKDLVAVLTRVYGRNADENTLAGVMGAFGRRVSSRYGLRNARGNAVMPFSNPRDRTIGSRVYVMTKEVAKVIATL